MRALFAKNKVRFARAEQLCRTLNAVRSAFITTAIRFLFSFFFALEIADGLMELQIGGGRKYFASGASGRPYTHADEKFMTEHHRMFLGVEAWSFESSV